jgi:hypothetical protein
VRLPRFTSPRLIVFGLAGLVLAYFATDFAYQRSIIRSLGDPADRLAEMQGLLPSFTCAELTVAEVYEPMHDISHYGGSLLTMPEACVTSLRAALRIPSEFLKSDFRENCYTAMGSSYDRELCFEREGVYFGALRPG